jgi:hypothetical protein
MKKPMKKSLVNEPIEEAVTSEETEASEEAEVSEETEASEETEYVQERVRVLGMKAAALMKLSPKTAPSEWHALLILLTQAVARLEYQLREKS